MRAVNDDVPMAEVAEAGTLDYAGGAVPESGELLWHLPPPTPASAVPAVLGCAFVGTFGIIASLSAAGAGVFWRSVLGLLLACVAAAFLVHRLRPDPPRVLRLVRRPGGGHDLTIERPDGETLRRVAVPAAGPGRARDVDVSAGNGTLTVLVAQAHGGVLPLEIRCGLTPGDAAMLGDDLRRRLTPARAGPRR